MSRGLGKYLRRPSLLARKIRWWLLLRGPRREVTVETANGILTFDSRDRIIGKHLYVRRTYEPEYLAAATAVLRREGFRIGDGAGHASAGDSAGSGRGAKGVGGAGGTVLDIGANIGMISIALLRQGLFERAVAVEPAPLNFRLLERNAAQNGLMDRVRCVHAAVSDRSGAIDLELSESNFGDNRLRPPEAASGKGAFREGARSLVSVPAVTLDELAGSEPWLAPDELRLIWIDVQGFEAHCFAGGRDVLSRGVPVVTEFWPYGISRSGTSQEAYTAVVGSLFTHYHDLSGDSARRPIGDLAALFESNRLPKQNRQLLLVRKR